MILPGPLQAAFHVPHHRQKDLGELLKTHESESSHEPGRSIKLRSATSEPVMWRTMRLAENESVFAALAPRIAPERKASDDVDGFKIALWALAMRSVTSDFSVIGCPNEIFRGFARRLPSEAVLSCNETVHVHGLSEYASWHSVGHLYSPH
jgi:hypothetical protein